jgi:NAD(P)-dependent dehydrogenase (short-subunit alcohol dehydrogenase family)
MLPGEYDISGKVAFITGAGRGIGKGIAQVLAEAGADIALNALTPKYVEGTAAEIAKSSGRRIVPVMADVTTTNGVQGAIDTVMKDHWWPYRGNPMLPRHFPTTSSNSSWTST